MDNQQHSSNGALLQVRELRTYFQTDEGVAKAVDGVSFELKNGETLGLVGESGCGKTVTALSIMRLVTDPPGKIVDGEILFKEQDLVKLDEHRMRRIRGNEISMIFQEPMTSLNPVFTCGNQIQEVIMLHQKLSRKAAREKTIEMIKLVGIPDPHQRVDEYPHQLSGGMRQRIMIAMALSCNPSILIADEPTTALDVTIQAQILELLQRLQADFGMSIMIITHDLGVIAEIADRVSVMYAGQIVESTDVGNIFANPKHPYTQGLLASIPKISEEKSRLLVIEGVVPNPVNFPTGCRFHPRCPIAEGKCSLEEQVLREVQSDHMVRCWKTT